MVRFYALNAQGEISHLILNDVTGDLHQYGVITSVEELDLGTMMGISSSYTYDVGGQKLIFGSTNAILQSEGRSLPDQNGGPQRRRAAV